MKLHKHYSKITTKGQITIPSAIRNKLDIPIGSKLELVQKDNYIIVIPINNSLSKLKGFLPKPDITLSVDEMNDIIKTRK